MTLSAEEFPAIARFRCSFAQRFAFSGGSVSLESSVRIQTRHRNNVNIVRINEVINGKPYVIEVLSVDRDRWRAHIVRYGTTTALMPFYGATPDEAALQLTRWLSRAGRPEH
jgi:hypothetical protein